MKKLALLSVVLIVFCLVASSCVSHEKCPAYSKINNTPAGKKSV